MNSKEKQNGCKIFHGALRGSVSICAAAAVCIFALAWRTTSAADGPATQLIVAPSPATQPTTASFEQEILAFEAADRAHPPAKGGIVFVGSSSIKKWTTLAQDFPGLPVLNRGFGGSLIPDSTLYAPRIVIPYAPKLVVFYAGDNDIAVKHSPELVLADFRKFVDVVRAALPQTKIDFISIKPSILRRGMMDQMRQSNRLVKQYIQTQSPMMDYIDVFNPMLDKDGNPQPELYVADGLHMTPAGYKIWTGVVGPYLGEGQAPRR